MALVEEELEKLNGSTDESAPMRARAWPRRALAVVLSLLALVAACSYASARSHGPADALTQGPQPNRTRLPRLWPNRTSFTAECGRNQALGTCPGYAQCMEVLYRFKEEEFVAKTRARREGPPLAAPDRPGCSKWSCIERANCTLPFKLYQYTHADLKGHPLDACLMWKNFTRKGVAQHITSDPGRACAFWFAVDRGCKALTRAKTLPFWHGNGVNHVFIDHWDVGITAQQRALYLGRAAIAQGHSTAERWVDGLDIALALHPKLRLTEAASRFATVAPWDRKYLLTFKGRHTHISRKRAGLHHDERRGVIIVTFPHPHQCLDSTSLARPKVGNKVLLPLRADCCEQLHAFYNSYDYSDLMNTTFALVMPGRQPASYRLAEVLGRGAVPVFFGFDEAVLPYDELIDWSAISLRVNIDASFEHTLVPLLERVREDHARVLRMQELGQQVFRKYFNSRNADAGDRAVIETLRRRFELES